MADQPSILFVDDEDSIRLTLPPLLQSYGFEVTAAATVAETLGLISQHKFDVLISDLNIGHPGDATRCTGPSQFLSSSRYVSDLSLSSLSPYQSSFHRRKLPSGAAPCRARNTKFSSACPSAIPGLRSIKPHPPFSPFMSRISRKKSSVTS